MIDISTRSKPEPQQAGRTLPHPFHACAVTSAVVLRSGETLTSERVIDACGAWVTTYPSLGGL